MSDNKKIVGALLLGAAAGAVLGLLFAPGKGNELRRKIKDSTGDLLDELTGKINEGKETLNELKENMTSKVGDIKSKAENDWENVKNKAKQTSVNTTI